MSVRTKKGDDGTSALIDGRRISKDHPVFDALGSIDMLSVFLGDPIIRGQNFEVKFLDKTIGQIIGRIQHRLYLIQSEIAGYGQDPISIQDVDEITDLIHLIEKEAEVDQLTGFVRSGASLLATDFDKARVIAREAERKVIGAINYSKKTSDKVVSEVSPQALAYLNSLSDLFFILARLANFLLDCEEKYLSSDD